MANPEDGASPAARITAIRQRLERARADYPRAEQFSIYRAELDDLLALLGGGVPSPAQDGDREELHRMQLTAIDVATLANTRATIAERLTSEHPYWTPAYAQVCTAVAREITARERAEAAEAELARVVGVPPPQPEQVTRLEVISDSGRVLVLTGARVELSYQDEGRTLKIFTKLRSSDQGGAEPGRTA